MPDPKMLSDFRSKFLVDALLVAKTDAWSWSVRPNQPTNLRGQHFVPKSPCTSLFRCHGAGDG